MPWTPPAADPAPDPLLTRAAALAVRGGPLGGPLFAFRSVESTQTVAADYARAGAPEGTVVVADHQRRGRGRRGRVWLAPPGRALLFSCVLRPPIAPARWPEIALAAGCGVAEAIETVAGGASVRLKWPNDVLAGGRKLAGILAEGVVGHPPLVVLGVGVNLAQAPADWPPALAGRATSLTACGTPVARWSLLAACLARVGAWYATLLARGLPPVQAAWQQRGLLGLRVATAAGEGVAEGLAPGGGLILRRADGTRAVVVAGEVTLPVTAGAEPGDGGPPDDGGPP
jgi:BirA family biotin operon repressor/biotin-[acetyl-CoA-carboxylase] ligase